MDFFDHQTLVARVVDTKSLPSQGLSFLSDENDFLQVGVWQHPKGHSTVPHIHNYLERSINRTTEVLYVVSGSVHADIYGEDGTFISSTNLVAGQLLLCFGGGHGYEILEENSMVLEFKNGPYLGAELDRTQIDQRCSCKAQESSKI
jgi:hypothetical protein